MSRLALGMLAAAAGGAAKNTYCVQEFTPGDDPIARVEGYMNVPIKPEVEPGKVLFLWPGLNPVGGEGGMMQPVLTYGVDYGQGPQRWGFANWFTNCGYGQGGYCHDPYLAVEEGDTLFFYMQWKGLLKNGSAHWEMGYRALNNPATQSTFQVYHEQGNVSTIWATEAEFYLDPAENPTKLPRSNYYTWGYKATSRSGKDVPLSWVPKENEPTAMRVACNETIRSGNASFLATELSYVPFHNGCEEGYARTWNAACAAPCGCNNADGSPKIVCDYCCRQTADGCDRAAGPTPAPPATRAFAADTSRLPVPFKTSRRQ
eukprot:TRINITY_DN28610_c0_g1_i1.p1 TRINITY_DN28610_c0_g1~~TRINITY_DN28610_c0_g1_i1.p1  ORF type:complete len:317 (+),score=113.59 TRINITY_DN28610_c0_g1_i1:52-1002(+)